MQYDRFFRKALVLSTNEDMGKVSTTGKHYLSVRIISVASNVSVCNMALCMRPKWCTYC